MTDSMTQVDRRRSTSTTKLAGTPYRYRSFGLDIASQLELPELAGIDQTEAPEPQVSVHAADCRRLVATPDELHDGICVRGEVAQFVVDGVARYSVEGGERIIIDRRLETPREDPVPDEDLRVYLLGSAMGALLFQRGMVPLHLSAVSTPSGIWAFTGPSGAGKSTLASWLSRTQGWPLLSDDVMAAEFNNGDYRLHPGPPRAKLWSDSLHALGVDRQGLSRDLSRSDKFHLRLVEGAPIEVSRLRGLVLLDRAEPGESARIEPIVGAQAFRACVSAIYRPSFASRLLGHTQLFARCAQLARSTGVYSFRRPWALGGLNDSSAALLRLIDRGT